MTNAFIDDNHPANLPMLHYLQATTQKRKKGTDARFALDEYEIQTHPDIGGILFDIGTKLNPKSVSVANGHPVLVCPNNGVIFAMATGTSTLVFRFSPEQFPFAISLGAIEAYEYGKKGSLKASLFGSAWLFIPTWPIPSDELYKMSYEYTCSLPVSKL